MWWLATSDFQEGPEDIYNKEYACNTVKYKQRCHQNILRCYLLF